MAESCPMKLKPTRICLALNSSCARGLSQAKRRGLSPAGGAIAFRDSPLLYASLRLGQSLTASTMSSLRQQILFPKQQRRPELVIHIFLLGETVALVGAK